MLQAIQEAFITEALNKIKEAGERAGKYSYLFETAYTLLAAVCDKYDIGKDIRTAYKEVDKERLKILCKRLSRIINKVKAFYKKFTAQWYIENKANGMEVHDARLSGLIGRLFAVKARIEKFISGDISQLEELSDTYEWKYPPEVFTYNSWAETISACPV